MRRMDAIEMLDPTTPPDVLQTTQRYYRVERRDISFLRFILEGYEGAAVLTTVDADNGIVGVRIAPGREQEIAALLDALTADGVIMVESLTDFRPVREGYE